MIPFLPLFRLLVLCPHLAVLSFRLRSHRTQDSLGQGGDHLLRHPWSASDDAVPCQHRRRDGSLLQVSILEGLLLRLHQEAKETTERQVRALLQKVMKGKYMDGL